MKAKEARQIWEEAIALKAQFYVEIIKKKILQYTFQEHASFYALELTDFIKNSVTDTEQEQDVSPEFMRGIFNYITDYFTNLGFKVKTDFDQYKVWITLPKKCELIKNGFSEKLMSISKARQNSRTVSEADNILSDIYLQIREKAKKNCYLNYSLTLNIPNSKSLLLDDLLAIIEELEQEGYTISLDGLLANQSLLSQKEYIKKDIIQGSSLENIVVNLSINW